MISDEQFHPVIPPWARSSAVFGGEVKLAVFEGVRWLLKAAEPARAARRLGSQPLEFEPRFKLFGALFNQFVYQLPTRLGVELAEQDVSLTRIARRVTNAVAAFNPQISGEEVTVERIASMSASIVALVDGELSGGPKKAAPDAVAFYPPYVSPFWLMQAANLVLQEHQRRSHGAGGNPPGVCTAEITALACLGLTARAMTEMHLCRSCFRWAVPGLEYCGLHGLAEVSGAGSGSRNERQRRYEAAKRVAPNERWRPNGLPPYFGRISSSKLPQVIARVLWSTPLPDEMRSVRSLIKQMAKSSNVDIAEVARKCEQERPIQVFDLLRSTVDPFEYRPAMWQHKVAAMERWVELAAKKTPGRRGASSIKVLSQITRAAGLARKGASKLEIAQALQVAPSSVSRWLKIEEGRELAALLDPAQFPEISQKRARAQRKLASASRNGRKHARSARPSDEPTMPVRVPLLAIRPVLPLTRPTGINSQAGGSKMKSADTVASRWPTSQQLLDAIEVRMTQRNWQVDRRSLKLYIAYRTTRNFITAVPRKKHLLLYLHLDPAHVGDLAELGRSVRGKSHIGTGDLELTLRSADDLDAAMPYLEAAYLAARD